MAGFVGRKFEEPIDVTATLPVNITWQRNTVNAPNLSDFDLNLWLLRKDSRNNIQVLTYLPVLLSSSQNVFNSTVRWIPDLRDVDIGVRQASKHQMTWELSSDNLNLEAGSINFHDFSTGFNVRDPNFGKPASSSITPASTSSTQSTTSVHGTSSVQSSTTGTSITSNLASSNSSGKNQAVIGLGVGFSLLGLMALLGGIVWAVRADRKVKYAKEMLAPAPPYQTQSPLPPIPLPKTT